jgi:hypothetical protein
VSQADLCQNGNDLRFKLPLRVWFKTIYLVTKSEKGISSIELVDALASPRRRLG